MISIVVPVFNTEKFLPQCLESLINQTYSDLEIVCVDDGSTDKSPQILKHYAENDRRIKVISQPNQGVSATRNTGIDHVQGEWLMFLDSDDWLENDCCEQIMTQADGKDLAFFSYIREFKTSSAPKYIFDERPRIFSGEQTDRLYQRLIAPKGKELQDPSKLDSLSTVWGKCYRSAIIREHHLAFVSLGEIGSMEDLLFNVEYFKHIRNAVYLPTPLYHYRKATASTLSSAYKDKLDKKWCRLFERIENIITPLNKQDLTEALRRRKALCLFGLGLNIVFSKKPWREQHRMLNDILSSNWYTATIAQLDTSPMPLHWHCFFGMARRQQTTAVLLMLQVINRIIKR